MRITVQNLINICCIKDMVGRQQLRNMEGAVAAIGNNFLRSKQEAASFCAEIAHETNSFFVLEEYASGAAYEGRKNLGNVRPGDGRRFKGRGLLQLTGRRNYEAFARDFGEKSIIAAPEAVGKYPLAFESARWYWEKNGLRKYAEAGKFNAVSDVINCGREGCALNGATPRRVLIAAARKEFSC